MASGPMSEVIQHLRRTTLLRDGAGLTDGQLLDDYVNRRDEGALAALVRRHGPMVWGVCRRVLRNEHDAEDAFQATFLVLVRRAASIASRDLLANWLYGVARQTALKARTTIAKRRNRERQVAEMPHPEAVRQGFAHDLLPLLDQELGRLPEPYRVALLLCDLGGKTRREAARQLGCPEGTLAGRLARARAMLARRMARRGEVLSVGALAAVLSEGGASGSVPASVVSSTIKAASLFAAGQAAAAGVVPVQVTALTDGVLKTMFLSKLKAAAVAVLFAAVLSGGAGLMCQTGAAEQPEPPKSKAPKPKPGDFFDTEGKLDASHFPEGRIASREELLWSGKVHIELAAKKVRESKDDKALLAALDELEQTAQMLKWSLDLMPEPTKKEPPKPKPAAPKKEPAKLIAAKLRSVAAVGDEIFKIAIFVDRYYPELDDRGLPRTEFVCSEGVGGVQVVIDGKPAKVADLVADLPITLQLSADNKSITRIEASLKKELDRLRERVRELERRK